MRLMLSSRACLALVVIILLGSAFSSHAIAREPERKLSREKLEQMQSERKYAYYLDDKAPEQHQGFLYSLLRRLFGRIVPSPVLDTIVRGLPYLIIIAAVVLIALRLFSYNISAPFKRQRKAKSSGYVFENRHPEAHGHILEYQWKKALENQDHRMAIRFAYQIILRILHQYRCIEWEPHKLNCHYLSELKGKPLYNDYKMAGKIFEYVWYGGFPAKEERSHQMTQLVEKIRINAKKQRISGKEPVLIL